ncbi:TPA: restriction endonuclease subunit S [Serratia marcescens]|uniref:Type I restriction enzyme EcoAI specificity protein n=1 Tax=Serratia marcescens subsp. marcescens Db11 TaxID=273526 RepID=A0ABC9IHN6_SERMA|nr:MULTISPECIES: restriction endonuclease subunit S [Serratia]CDG12174.1 type I restriction enzyme EcoAI specificity protein [Serratia marcescens subsp. marcescens Db11]
MSVEKMITDHIDIWSSALQTRSTAGRGSNGKINLYGIKKLRELILELAVRGKLVPQDPNDEPASELLKLIAAEKAELVKQGKMKKQKPLPEISEDEKPFELPVGWGVIRLGEIATKIGSGSTPRGGQSTYVSSGIPFLRSQNIWNDGLKLDDVVFITSEVHSQMEGSQVEKFDILLNITGASLGRSAIYPNNIGEANVNQHVTIIRLIKKEMISFLHLAITSPVIQKLIWGRQVGMAIEGLSKKTLELFEIPVPPLSEQLRIVHKARDLMSLCDQLEQQSLTSLDAHQQLVETLLASLTDSQSAEELAENWARISQHFDTLFTTEASIDALKQTILQLAVMGKLVPQDPNDEPASELLKRIEQEKAQLVKEGKIKKQKPLPPVSDKEKPFELPQGWEWCRLGHCIHLISGQHLKPNEYSESIVEGAIPYITGPAEFGDSNPTYSKFTLEKRAVAKPKDILITCKGAGLGKLNVANVEIAISRQLMSIRAISTSFDYFKLLLSSMYNYFQGKGIGIAIPGISREDVTEPVILLPPLNEQERIVLNVNSLFGLCDTLKSRLQSTQQTQLHLADALTDAALN